MNQESFGKKNKQVLYRKFCTKCNWKCTELLVAMSLRLSLRKIQDFLTEMDRMLGQVEKKSQSIGPPVHPALGFCRFDFVPTTRCFFRSPFS